MPAIPTIDSRDASVINWLGGSGAAGASNRRLRGDGKRGGAFERGRPSRGIPLQAAPAILPSANGSSTLYRALRPVRRKNRVGGVRRARPSRHPSCQTVHDAN
ncbi:MAG: hypothetical protein U1E87_04660 [Alphaproteobacteria bacterium]